MTDASYAKRPYVGRHIPPPHRNPPPPQSIEERIAVLVEAVGMARSNAHIAARNDDYARSSAAFYRAHKYVEMIRVLRGLL